MRAASVLLVLATLSASGCADLMGGCGPQVMSVSAEANVPGHLTEAHVAALRSSLANAGFSVAGTVPHVVATRGGETVVVADTGSGNETRIYLDFDVERRGFSDDQSGIDAAYAYIAEESARLQPTANATFALVVKALELPPTSAPKLGGGYAIC